MNIKIVELKEGFIPVYKHSIDACCDCFANIENPISIAMGSTVTIPLGFSVEIPIGYEGIVKGCRGLSAKGIFVQQGSFDPDYTGEVCVIISNFSGSFFNVNPGDRICQFKIQESEKILFEKVPELTSLKRGMSGFGSTGVSK